MTHFSDQDIHYMTRALLLADSVKGKTFPNPAVGAVIVKNGSIVGAGATDRYGGPHAEKNAIQSADRNIKNSSLYVTLEPCHHFGKTPPCTHSIVKSGIKRVFVATKDPNPIVSGRGIRYLRSKGISVYTGLLKREADYLNEDYFWSITRKTPWISIKLAMTLDGKIADKNRRSLWITNRESRTYVHDLRRRHAAVAVGGKTALIDNPKLSVRHVKGVSPVRFVFTSAASLPKTSNLSRTAKQIRTIIVSPNGRAGAKKTLFDGMERWFIGKNKSPQNLHVFMKMAYNEGLTSILIEGGQQLASSFIEHKLTNRLYFFFGNSLLGGGIDAISFVRSNTLKSRIRLKNLTIRRFNDNMLVSGIPVWER